MVSGGSRPILATPEHHNPEHLHIVMKSTVSTPAQIACATFTSTLLALLSLSFIHPIASAFALLLGLLIGWHLPNGAAKISVIAKSLRGKPLRQAACLISFTHILFLGCTLILAWPIVSSCFIEGFLTKKPPLSSLLSYFKFGICLCGIFFPVAIDGLSLSGISRKKAIASQYLQSPKSFMLKRFAKLAFLQAWACPVLFGTFIGVSCAFAGLAVIGIIAVALGIGRAIRWVCMHNGRTASAIMSATATAIGAWILYPFSPGDSRAWPISIGLSIAAAVLANSLHKAMIRWSAEGGFLHKMTSWRCATLFESLEKCCDRLMNPFYAKMDRLRMAICG